MAFARSPVISPAGPLSLHDAIEAAWVRLPQRPDFKARQQVAAARNFAGGALFPNAPSVTGTFVNDRILGSNYNFVTSQGQLSTPIWLPGEGTASQKAARADNDAIGAEAEAVHLALAGQILDLASQAVLATDTRDAARRRLAASRALAADLGRRFRIGESAESDALAAEADAASVSIILINAEAQLASIRLTLASATGIDVVPRIAAPAPLALSLESDSAFASHPRIVATELAVATARAKSQLTRIQNRDSPEIGVQVTNDKQPGTPWDTRVGVVFRLPFATEGRNAPLRAAAEQMVTQAEVQRVIARREVVASVRTAQAVLVASERAIVEAERGAGVLDRRRGQIERAWRMGEMSLIEVVRANALAFDAELARDRARTSRDTARQSLRIAEGMVP